MKHILLVILLGIGMYSAGQSVSGIQSPSAAVSPEQVSMVKAAEAKSQAFNWKSIAFARKTNANAWLNYYIWLLRDQSHSEAPGFEIIEARKVAGNYVADSWQYSLINYLHSKRKNPEALYDALQRTDDTGLVLPYAIQYFVESGITDSIKRYTGLLEGFSPMKAGVKEYYWNALSSAGRNAMIYTKGLNDIVSMAIIQQVYEYRKDVKLIPFEQGIEINEHSYASLTLGKEILKSYPKGVFAGLLIKLDGKIAAEPEDLQDQFLITELYNDRKLSSEEKELYKNYLPVLLLAYKNYLLKDQAKAEAAKTRLLSLSRRLGLEENIKSLMEAKR